MRSATGPRVLLAEDNDAVLRMVKQTLEENGYPVVCVKCGAEVVDLVRKCKPELILMDMMMPLLDGYAAARALRRDPETRRIPIIAFNAPNTDKIALNSFDRMRLLSRIEQALGERPERERLEMGSCAKERRWPDGPEDSDRR